jgi:uncharacterized membrane protein (DUF2068 family)
MIHKLRIGIHRKGLHVVAAFEALKGFLVLAAGFGLLRFIHHDLQKLGEHLVVHFGMHEHSSQIFMRIISGLHDRELVMIACLAFAYSALRFVEAYGLWKQRTWAQWLAIISGGLYLPLEFYGLYNHFTILKSLVTLFNILLLVYLVWIKNIDDKARARILGEEPAK